MPVTLAISVLCALVAADGADGVVARATDLRGGTWTVRADSVHRTAGRDVAFLTRLIGARDVRPLGPGAAFVLEPPNLLLARDTDGDGAADTTCFVASGLASGTRMAFGDDGWLYVVGTASRYRWDGISLRRLPDLAAPLGEVAMTSAGDRIEILGGELRLWPGDPIRLPSGEMWDAPPMSVGAVRAPDSRLLRGIASPADGSLERVLVTGDVSAFERPASGFRWLPSTAAPPAPMPVPPPDDLAGLALLCASPDPAQRGMAVEELLGQPREQAVAAAADPLRALARSHVDATVRRLALATLERLGALTEADITAAHSDASPLVRRFAASVAADTARSLVAALGDPARALAMSDMIDGAIAAHRAEAHDAAARNTLIAAARGRETLLIERLFARRATEAGRGDAAWWGDTLLDDAISAAARAGEPATTRRLLELAADRAGDDRHGASDLIRAAFAAVRPNGRKHAMVQLDRAPSGYRTLLASEVAAPFAPLDAWIRWPGRSDVAAPPLATSLEETIELGRQVYSTCLTCHGPAGRGQPGVYPPLAGSEYVTGDPERFARIVLHGLKGKVQVGTVEVNGLMPRPAIESDEEIAAVMTYVRQAFGNGAAAVTPAQVKAARERHRDRTEPWDVRDLDAPKPSGQ